MSCTHTRYYWMNPCNIINTCKNMCMSVASCLPVPSQIRAWLLKRKSGIFPCALFHVQLFIYQLYVCVRFVRVCYKIVCQSKRTRTWVQFKIMQRVGEKWEWFERVQDLKEKLFYIPAIRNKPKFGHFGFIFHLRKDHLLMGNGVVTLMYPVRRM